MTNTPTRRIVAGLFLAALLFVCLFNHLNVLGLVGPDEPRYAAIAREMAASGDWVTPRLNGKPWFEKPVLYYWLAASSFHVFGVSEFAARFPSALLATLALLAMGWLGWRLGSPRAGWLTIAIGATSAGIIGFARAATTDMPLSATLALALVAACVILWPEKISKEDYAQLKRPISANAFFGGCLGLATLAKGPVAVVLIGGAATLLAVGSGDWRKVLRLLHPVGILVWMAVTLPWYILCAWRHPDFVSTFLLSHNVERFFTPVFRHEQPFWFFGPILLFGVAPWTMPLLGLLGTGLKKLREKAARDTPKYFLACAVVFVLLFFSISRSKLPGYILPALFPLSLLLALWLCAALENKSPVARWTLAGVGLVVCLLASTTTVWQRKLPAEALGRLQEESLASIIVIFAGGALVAGLAVARHLWPALIASLLLTAILVEGINLQLLPRLDAHITPRAAASIIAEVKAPVFSFQLHRAWQFGLNFYLRRELAAWNSQDGTAAVVITSSKGVEQIRALGRRVTVKKEISSHAVLVEVDAGH